MRLTSYQRSSTCRSPIYPYEKLSGPKMCHQAILPEIKNQSPPPGTYEIQRFPSLIFQTTSNQVNNKNTYSFNNKSRSQPLGSSTCNGESKFYIESKWEGKIRSFSPSPLTYDKKNEWEKNRNSPTSITDRVSSPIPKTSDHTNHTRPWNDYKTHIKTQSSLSHHHKNMCIDKKKELIEKQNEVNEVYNLPRVTHM